MRNSIATHFLRLFVALLAVVCASPLEAQLLRLPDAPQLSPQGHALIVEFETGGEAYYERFESRPTWPGAYSGVTVGCGYDLGYNSATAIRSDWQEVAQVERLAAQAGVTGAAARVKVRELQDILISWNLAMGVFDRVTVTRFWLLTRRTFPGFDQLAPNCQAALVSLVFNRGASMVGPRRSQMRNIARLTPVRNYKAIAQQIRDMKSIWAGSAIAEGMRSRREAEAQLVERCL